MIGIISAMEIEMELLKKGMIIREEKVISASTYYIGTFCEKEIVLVQCGVGKVNAAMCAQTLILMFKPSLIINLGVAGGIGKNIKIGDLVVVTSCVQHDFDTSILDGTEVGTLTTNKGNIRFLPFDEKYTELFFEKATELYKGAVHKGIVATGDQFVADPEKCKYLNKEFSAEVCEMEIGSIAQVCYLNDTALVSLKSISDNADDDGKMDFMTFVKKSSYRNEEFLQKVFKDIEF